MAMLEQPTEEDASAGWTFCHRTADIDFTVMDEPIYVVFTGIVDARGSLNCL